MKFLKYETSNLKGEKNENNSVIHDDLYMEFF